MDSVKQLNVRLSAEMVELVRQAASARRATTGAIVAECVTKYLLDDRAELEATIKQANAEQQRRLRAAWQAIDRQ